MKLLFSINSNVSGGAERVMITLANHFADNGHSVCLLNFDKNSSFYNVSRNVSLIKIGDKYNINPSSNKFFKNLKIRKCVHKEISSFKPDIVVPFLFDSELFCIPYCCLHRINCVASVRNDAKSYPWYQRLFRKHFFRKIAGVVFQSEAVASFKDFKRIHHSTVIYNPLSIDIQERSGVDFYKIISVGRLNKQKNHKLLIEAISRLVSKYPKIHLHIFGDGELKTELIEYARSLNVSSHVFLEGSIKDAIVKNNDAQLFIMPSNYEGFPNALLEAMAAHIPVVSTSFESGTADFLIGNNERGFLFNVGDVGALVSIIDYSFSNRAVVEEKGDKASKFCSQFNCESIANQWNAFFRRVIK